MGVPTWLRLQTRSPAPAMCSQRLTGQTYAPLSGAHLTKDYMQQTRCTRPRRSDATVSHVLAIEHSSHSPK
eukprot:956238-Amphidinium_carterae.1